MALIYIVEDDDNIREIEKFALKNNGHIIYDFADTQSFLKKISDKIPELAIIDVMLPDRDGYEIVERLRANPKTKKLPIIMVTAKTTELDMIRGLELGADDYIKKPFSVIELMTRVKALLRRSAMDTEQEKVMELGNIVLNDKRHFVSVDGEQIELTYKEFELLKFLMINTGIGISQEHQERVFERFYRVDKSRSRQSGGTGLGLAIVKHIVALHNATIQLSSFPGKGTKIVITF
jgi:two-component system alkaline phosphatase synthesis response regulator PhoP